MVQSGDVTGTNGYILTPQPIVPFYVCLLAVQSDRDLEQTAVLNIDCPDR